MTLRFRTLNAAACALAALLLPAAAAAADVCGDGLVAAPEGCDDGNLRDGDGCSSGCNIEAGYACDLPGNSKTVVLLNPGFEDCTTPDDWSTLAGDVAWLHATAFDGCYPPGDGTASLNLNGDLQGAIGQAFDTIKGAHYTVSFLGNTNCREAASDLCTATCSRTIAVGVAEDTSAADALDAATPFSTAEYLLQGSPQSVKWQQLHYEFTATAARTLLFFSGTDASGGGPMLDDVKFSYQYCALKSCGDGVLDALEGCDDGNRLSGDGCSMDCKYIESGYACAPGAACTTPCGNGKKANTEGCDDGNTSDGDGCSSACVVEPGSVCSIVPPTLLSVCTCDEPGYSADCKEIDECVDGVDGDPARPACGENQQCMNTAGSYGCMCAAGFAPVGAADANGKVDCEDVDECAPGAANGCVEEAVCTNKPGSYTCECPMGSSGNGVDSCVSHACDDHLDCTDNAKCRPRWLDSTTLLKMCVCMTNYVEDRTVTDRLVCKLDPVVVPVAAPADSGCSIDPGPSGTRRGALAMALAAMLLGLVGRRRPRVVAHPPRRA